MSLTYVKMNNKIVYLQVMALITFLATPFMRSLGILSICGVLFQMINPHLYTCIMSKFKTRDDDNRTKGVLDTSPLCGVSGRPPSTPPGALLNGRCPAELERPVR